MEAYSLINLLESVSPAAALARDRKQALYAVKRVVLFAPRHSRIEISYAPSMVLEATKFGHQKLIPAHRDETTRDRTAPKIRGSVHHEAAALLASPLAQFIIILLPDLTPTHVGGSLIVARRGRQLIVQESCSNLHHCHSLAHSSPDLKCAVSSRPRRTIWEALFFVCDSLELATMMAEC